ncbi:MAG: hypothetical protein ACOZAL_00345, partial [Patescibacteria group bacterium]
MRLNNLKLSYLLFIILLIFLAVFLSFKIVSAVCVKCAPPKYDACYFSNKSISPSPWAKTTITISGDVTGAGKTTVCENGTDHKPLTVDTLEYQIDGGGWKGLVWKTDWWLAPGGEGVPFCDCCYPEAPGPYRPYKYHFSKTNINISGYVDGPHTLTVRATNISDGKSCTTAFSFSKDTTAPTCSISYPNGLNQTTWLKDSLSFNVGLTESDT